MVPVASLSLSLIMPVSSRKLPLDASVSRLRGVGRRAQAALGNLGIETIEELLFHFPRRYLDLRKKREIGQIKDGESVTVVGEVVAIQSRRLRGASSMVVATLKDTTGYLEIVWFNQPYMEERLPLGTRMAVSGTAGWRFGRLQMSSPLYDVFEGQDPSLNTSGIIPLHRATKGFSTGQLRRLVNQALTTALPVPEILTSEVLSRHSLMGRAEAIAMLHFPRDVAAYKRARLRMVFEELFVLEVLLFWRRHARLTAPGAVTHSVDSENLADFYRLLPWRLTAEQKAAVAAILADMSSGYPMRRLLHGEVGSGKTVVAAAALVAAASSGYQAALMAPTEVLAAQHFSRLVPWLRPLGISVALLIGATSAQEKKRIHAGIKSGEVAIVVGTHAILQEKVSFHGLGLVVIDEQHRFGVKQRMTLRHKSANPDVLVMSATPIPRTLAQTLYGDLDISELRCLPSGLEGAANVETKWMSEDERQVAYEMLRRHVATGRQAYVICPLVDESDKVVFKSVEKEAVYLRDKVLPGLRVEVLHGRLEAERKAEVMERFHAGLLDVLIATTVVEVGIDVPNATLMIIEHAERFGLSQLHQLRGRVGRGKDTGKCLIFARARTPESARRLEALLTSSNGFELAEADLAIRGQGEVFGVRQSGLPDLKVADITKHASVLAAARCDAEALVSGDPGLGRPENQPLRRRLEPYMSSVVDWLEL